MANFTVFIPPRKGSDMPSLTVKVEASNWLVALKQGLQQIGEQGDSLANIVCETAPDGSLRVADPNSRRVFLVTKLPDSGDDALQKLAEQKAAESRKAAEAAAMNWQDKQNQLQTFTAMPAVKAPEPPAKPSPQAVALEAEKRRLEEETRRMEAEKRRLEEERQRLEREVQEARTQMEEAARVAVNQAQGMVGKVEVTRELTSTKGWDDLDDWYDGVDVQEATLDDVLSDVFMSTADLHEFSAPDAARKVLDIAMEHIQSEAASVFYSDMNSPLRDLVIVSAKGPVARKVVGARVPLGRGIVGFSVVNGVRLTVNNVNKNPNFYGQLDKDSGFTTKSILCVPVQASERTFGAIELINKVGGGNDWTTFDSNVLESLGQILGKALETQFAAQKL